MQDDLSMLRLVTLCSIAGVFALGAIAPTRAVPAGDEASLSLALPALAYPTTAPGIVADPSGPPAETPAKAAALQTSKPTAADICQLIAANADAVGMSRDFFARLIWKESRFDSGAISPVGAQGIAQFMPYTADERGLADPYDVASAIRHSALYLSDLKDELGNWGLAAAAYNGGINRVKGWIANGGSLPYETEEYVNAITFRPADWFKEDGNELEERRLDAELGFPESCAKLPVMKTRAIFATVESAPMRPWGVQVAGHVKQSVAMKMFRRVQSAYSGILGGKAPLVLRDRAGGRARIYAVRIGADTRGEADRLCQRLRGAGGSCVVMKN
ncbi:lytic transglycosylase domain-containing protein [Aurantimonas marianensis]|uniref:Lytic transglycosylase domain-containing protein n=1 Tax=Aurantimonas marianensis TaxID=2920428 RepID=A0A9X2KDJ2_9HYPH|nr:lytic transglycosylase domain-containing protein [Aurantimonas marianensis]MCP3053679.1 lytic transglycosylase domain-containing protein [Aurantimonas marianensis]